MSSGCVIPPLPWNEPLRLRTLHRYAVLDTPAEAVHDRITRLAARMFDTPVSLITLLDDTRQWFKSHHGLDLNSTPRDLAFCAYTIVSDDVTVVPDACEDERFAENPLVTSAPGIRFYAGAPLRAPGNLVLGSLCVIDFKPRPDLDAAQRAALQDLSDLAMHEIEARHAADIAAFEIGQRRRAEQELAAALVEKDTLLREIHHRVKNNLQSLWGLVQIEKSRMQDGHARGRLDAVSQRITVMGNIHKQLYSSHNFSGINLPDHLEELCQSLIGLYGCPEDVTIEVRAEQLECGLDTAIPLGLIANEVISNSLKHGFPSGRTGNIVVALHRTGEDEGELTLSDDGVGLKGIEPIGIGMTLIHALVDQIGASFNMETTSGCTVRIRFQGCR